MAPTVERRELLAYLIGAGVAGTVLVFPYVGQGVAASVAPDFHQLTYVPFFLLPLAWGAWNWLYARLAPRAGIGAWGAVLGVVLASAVNLLLLAEGRWFQGALLLPATLPAVYYLVWLYAVGTLNEALGIAR